jgi:hypothetical protein
MGQYSGFVARVQPCEIKQVEQLLIATGNIRELTVHPELSLIIGLIKSDRDRGAFCTLSECGIDDFRMLGQLDSPADDYPRDADILSD